MDMTGKGKRKASTSTEANSRHKRAKNASVQDEDTTLWPDYFHQLFKLYKALNTVLAFCSARKALATSFPVVRTSVENITKRPLDLAQVSEIKALLPDLVSFAYIPADDERLDNDSSKPSRGNSPDLFELKKPKFDEYSSEAHVLLLEFVKGTKRNPQGKKNASGFLKPLEIGPQALKNLIEKRNSRFAMAVNELINACESNHEDPVSMIQSAGQEHVPVNPSAPSTSSTSHHSEAASRALTSLSSLPSHIPSPSRPSISALISEIEESDSYKSQIQYRRTFGSREPQLGSLNRDLSPDMKNALQSVRGVNGFYTHQAQAINSFWEGQMGVVVSTATASGKSVIYQIPTLCALEADPDATALFIYPTKALAQDQLASLRLLIAQIPSLASLASQNDPFVATYDGDTPADKRPGIRDNVRIIFTNFDMIHAAILPGEEKWRRFLQNLKIVVVDELHYYSGLMGSHVALVMRRFRRVCAAVGNRNVQFISCSATMSNPAQHMSNIFGIPTKEIDVITSDGSPSGPKDFIIWLPPLKDEMVPDMGRVRAIVEGVALFCALLKKGVRTIVFCKIRRTCELFMKSARAELISQGRNDIAVKVKSYRGGYSPEERRQIEAEAFSGDLLGLIATNALELGVDIGALDAVISLGFPFNVASFRQQSGRAGRRARDSLSVFVSDSLPIDKHFVANPEAIFDQSTDDLIIDTENRVILSSHLQCAAHEMPINPDQDEHYFGPLLKELCESFLEKDEDGWYHPHTKYLPRPSVHVALRGTREDTFTIVDITNANRPGGGSKILEEIEVSRAIFETYEGGVFMHQGLTFIVKEVSHDERIAKIARADVSYTTRPRDYTNVDAVHTHRIREIRGSPQRAYYGRVDIKTVVFSFFKIRNNEILDAVDIETPPFERESTGIWIDIPASTLDMLFRKDMNPAEGIHSAQHAIMSLTPLYSMAGSGDIRTECKAPQKENMAVNTSRKRPARLIFYDAAGKGSGICARAFDHITDLLQQALYVIENCDCVNDDGCPSCIQSASCKEGNAVSSKLGALAILQSVCGRPVTALDLVPDVPLPMVIETVVPASEVKGSATIPVEADTEE